MVRLKEGHSRKKIQRYHISIPYGAIKSYLLINQQH